MTNLVEVLAAEDIKLDKFKPGSHKVLCPRCSFRRKKKKEPCLSVTIEDDGGVVWLCHNDDCGWSGGWKPRREPANDNRRPVKPTFRPSDPNESVIKWMRGRGISEATVRRNGITLVDKAWMPGRDVQVPVIAFPYFRRGEIINVKYRSAKKAFRQESGAEKVFYGLDDIEGQSEVIICEGEVDKLSFEEAGFRNTVSVPDGAPGRVKDKPFDPADDKAFQYVWNCREYFEGVKRIILATDADPPGQALATELARRLGKERCWRVSWPSINDVVLKDANEVLMAEGVEVLREVVAGARPWPIKSLQQADAFRHGVYDAYARGFDRGLSTGFSNLDELYRVRAGDMTVVTGVPGSGKSEFIDAVLVNMAEKHHWRFALCSFENPPEMHIIKLAEKRARAPFWDGPRPRMSERELRDAMDWVDQHFVFLRADDESPTIDWILQTARAAVLRFGIRGLIIDPYNEIEHIRPSRMTETEYVSQILSKVKRWGQLHDAHIWFVAHPAKLQRDKSGQMPQPNLYDISGSAHWVNKADIGLVVHREHRISGDITKALIKKVRFKTIGQVGEAEFAYDPATGRYESRA